MRLAYLPHLKYLDYMLIDRKAQLYLQQPRGGCRRETGLPFCIQGCGSYGKFLLLPSLNPKTAETQNPILVKQIPEARRARRPWPRHRKATTWKSLPRPGSVAQYGLGFRV